MNITKIDFENLQCKPLGMEYDLYMTQDEIEDGEQYNGFLALCKQLSERDVVNLTISCYGGRLSTMSLIATAIEQSNATFVAHLNGVVWSASTFIALACDAWTVGDLVEFGCHSVQSGTGYTELAKMKARTDATDKLNRLMIDKYYANGFLTENECKRIDDGAEITFFKDELTERLKNYAEQRSKQEQDFLNSLNDSDVTEIIAELSDEELQEELQLATEAQKEIKKEIAKRKKDKK